MATNLSNRQAGIFYRIFLLRTSETKSHSIAVFIINILFS